MTRTRANQQKDKDKDARSRETRASLSNYVIFYKMAMIQGVFLLVLRMELVPPNKEKRLVRNRLIITLSVVFNVE